MNALTNLWNENPKSVSFVLGVVVTLIIVGIVSLLFREHFYTEVTAQQILNDPALEWAMLQGGETRNQVAPPVEEKLNPSMFSNPEGFANNSADQNIAENQQFYPMGAEMEHFGGKAEPADNDSIATELLLNRGGGQRAVYDGARSKYLGLASLGGDDYVGYDWRGQPQNDESDLLSNMGWGVNESGGF